MSGATSIAFLGGVVVLWFVAVPALMLFLIERRLPWGISRRLLRGKKSITVRTRYAGGTWNPAKPPGERNHTPSEPGWAFYTLDKDGMVELELVRTDGAREYYTGPPVDPPEGYRRVRAAGVIPLLTYPIFIGGGFAVGVLVSGGSQSHRYGDGGLGAVLGFALAWLALTVVTGVAKARRGCASPTADR